MTECIHRDCDGQLEPVESSLPPGYQLYECWDCGELWEHDKELDEYSLFD